MFSTKLLIASMAIVLSAGVSMAAQAISTGKVKSIDADNKKFVLTDSADKDFTFKFADNLVVNRAGKEGNSDLKAGDTISVCYDKGTFTWTVHYILVHEGVTKNCELIVGAVKSYDSDKKELTFTNEAKKDTTYPIGNATVRVNMEDAKIDTIKIGDHAVLMVDTVDGKATLRSVMVDRAK